MSDAGLLIPLGDDVSELADWIELQVAARGDDIPLSRLRRWIDAEGSELADEEFAQDYDLDADGESLEVVLDVEEAAKADVEARIEQLCDEIDMRKAVGSKVYPFEVADERFVRRAASGSDVYLLLLVLGSQHLPYRQERRAYEVEETYDLISLAALRRYLGRDADGVRFARTGTPEGDGSGDDPRRRPTPFPEAIEWLRDLLDLGAGIRKAEDTDPVEHWEFADEPETVKGRPRLHSYNDAGVDVVVWWKFKDLRAGAPVLLAQCTVQLAWERKLNDINLDLWQKWIDFETTPPQRALVIPFADRRDHPLWDDRTTKAGVIVDRVRLVELLDELSSAELADLVPPKARRWTATELSAIAPLD